ncbi:aminopeptidase P family protein, partial [Candidatus Bipolaricaulota bacterium]|nr:aminopeptidase P family protein [Candidatus Bipolaricaulota bacterium]
MNTSDCIYLSQRVDALIELMRREGLDLALLFDRDNIRYFTGFRLNRVVSSMLAISPTEGATYIVAKLDLNRAKRDCWIDQIISFPEDTPNYLDVLHSLISPATRSIGTEKDTITLAQADYLKNIAGDNRELVDVRSLTAKLRVIKSPQEIENLHRAADIASHAMEQVQGTIQPGMREAELSAWVMYLMAQGGAEGSSFEPFFMSGEDAWLPQRISSQKKLREGELALLDMGAIYDGYCSDTTRTFGVGELSPKQIEIFHVAREAQQAAIDSVCSGVAACDVDAAARTVVKDAGYGKFFPHLTGHGVGLSTHEAP